MKIEAKARTEKLNRRFMPYLTLKRRRIIMQTTTIEFKEPSFNSYHTTMNEANHLNIKFLRECSWTDSDSPTEESEEEVESNIQATHPRPTAPFRSRISHRVRISSEDVMVTREETHKCIVGFLLDMRRFSSETIQRWANQEWDPHGEITVVGRDDNRYLIYISDETDRRVALEQTPWSYQGALFATRRWNPNVPLRDMVLDRIELWLQIVGLPVEYQNNIVAEKLARTAGEIIKIDWVHRRPRNIRFLRVRIALDPRQPLASGHTHPYCSNDAVEVDRMVRQRMRPITERYGHPIVTDSQNNMFSNRSRLVEGGPQVATITQPMIIEPTGAGGSSHEEEGAQLALVSLGNEDVQIQLQSLVLRKESTEGMQNTTEVVELVPEEESTQIIETTEILGQMRVQEELEVLSADSGQHSQIIQQEDPAQHQLPLGDISQTDLYNSGYHNLADLEDMQFALYREHGRFEQICDEMVRQSTELLEGLQNRSLNDPTIQPANNNVRWISLPDGGAVYTNARLEMGGRKDIAESSQMGSNRNKPPILLLGVGSPVNPTSPGFICSINEEDLMSAFLRDTPSPDEGPLEVDEEGKEVIKENSLEGDGIAHERETRLKEGSLAEVQGMLSRNSSLRNHESPKLEC
ncbi:hypothetical protein COLO4_19587 [Corchorus olitorius]|uniref:DUF4283 domain-containing protein n=1 Tax=Corchorus olitorius TaxID=93759 RepID=A0A1R3J4P4_9ROSI|nr:hypothetical protein COLO4_19587 [Corchorus olitorius]